MKSKKYVSKPVFTKVKCHQDTRNIYAKSGIFGIESNDLRLVLYHNVVEIKKLSLNITLCNVTYSNLMADKL